MVDTLYLHSVLVMGYPRGLITSRRKSVSKQAIAVLIKYVLSVLILLQALTPHNKSKSLQYREVIQGALHHLTYLKVP